MCKGLDLAPSIKNKQTNKQTAYVIGSTGIRQRSGQTSKVTWSSRKFQGCATKSKTGAGTFQGVAPYILSKKWKSQYKTSRLLTTLVKLCHRRGIYKTPKAAASPGGKGLLISVSWGQERHQAGLQAILAVMEGLPLRCFLFCLEMGSLLIRSARTADRVSRGIHRAMN